MSKIIIIEDDPFLLNVLADKFTEKGFHIETAVNGEEGLIKIKADKFDLVLLDMVLPKMDGFGVLDELRKDNELKSLPVIVLSNLYDKNSIDKANVLGARDYIVKAYNTPENIVSKVKSFLEKEAGADKK